MSAPLSGAVGQTQVPASAVAVAALPVPPQTNAFVHATIQPHAFFASKTSSPCQRPTRQHDENSDTVVTNALHAI